MRYFQEYCEVYLESAIAPYKWVFKAHEPIGVKFGVALCCNPASGLVVLEMCDDRGNCQQQCLEAGAIEITSNNFQLFSRTLPLAANGMTYRYRIGYRDSTGQEHTSSQVRTVLICDEAPQSMAEIENVFLGTVEGRALYGPKPTNPLSPGPQDWNSRLFYSLIVDRFARTHLENRQNLGLVPYDSTSPHASHGGTLQGIIEKLEYLETLGVGAIIISPVYVNEESGYHGYHPLHLLMVEPRLGTLKILRNLVREARDRNIAVILDVVVNHLADCIDWEDYGGPAGGEFKYIQGREAAVLPLPIECRNTSLFHGPEYTDIINQRLFGFLEDWRTETTYVRELLIQHLKYWLSETDVDGFRYDSARHVGVDFWKPCLAEIERYATQLGKKQFLQIAEHAGSCHEELTAYNDAGFSGFLDYPTHYILKHSLGNGDWLGGFADYFCGFLSPTSIYSNGWRNNLFFLDNQDTSRILHEFLTRHTERETATKCLHFALACAILGPQRPTVYAGTEQEFSGALGIHQREDTGEWIGHDCHVREDMFDNPGCIWKFGPINHKLFQPYNRDHATFKTIQKLAALRRQNPLIERCTRTVLTSHSHGLRCILLHEMTENCPMLAVMNLGIEALTETALPLPKMLGEIASIEVQLATAGGVFDWLDGQIGVQLPPFSFILAKIALVSQSLSLSPKGKLEKTAALDLLKLTGWEAQINEQQVVP